MAKMTCPAPYCRAGMVPNGFGGTMPCIVCKGTGRVERREVVPSTSRSVCPYNACGGACGGKGYYSYRGHTIYCNVG